MRTALKSKIALRRRQRSLHIEQKPIRLQQPAKMFRLRDEIVVRNSKDNSIVMTGLGQGGSDIATVFFLNLSRIGPGIDDIDSHPIVAHVVDKICGLGVPRIRAVFLERETRQQNTRALYGKLALDHQLDKPVHGIACHAVVDFARCG